MVEAVIFSVHIQRSLSFVKGGLEEGLVAFPAG
jgi:hypothetical protein